MQKNLWLIILLFSITETAQCQVNMALQIPPFFVVQKNQLWNMSLFNLANNTVSVYISLSLLSNKDNMPVMTATTKPILLQKGAKQISPADVYPIQYNYLSAAFNIDRSADGFLPLGGYRACFTVYKTDNDFSVTLAEDCVPVDVQPLGPPILHNPPDEEAVQSLYPQFVWLPPVPSNLFSTLSYDLLIVEVLPGQTKGDAIQKNLPVIVTKTGDNPFYNYPASGKAFDTGRIYAWKVVANNEGEPVAQSETWTFRVQKSDQSVKDSVNNGYLLLRSGLDAVYKVAADSIHIKYFSFNMAQDAELNFSDENGGTIYTETRRIIPGDNYVDIALKNHFKEGKIYQVTITNSDNKKHTAKFSISK